jgi:hypothetical protein
MAASTSTLVRLNSNPRSPSLKPLTLDARWQNEFCLTNVTDNCFAMQFDRVVCNIASGGWKFRTSGSRTMGFKLPATLCYAKNYSTGAVPIYFTGFCTFALIPV